MYVVVLIDRGRLGKVTYHQTLDDAFDAGAELYVVMCRRSHLKTTKRKARDWLVEHNGFVGPGWDIYIGTAKEG